MKSVHRYSFAGLVIVGVIVGAIVLLLNQGPIREGGVSKAAIEDAQPLTTDEASADPVPVTPAPFSEQLLPGPQEPKGIPRPRGLIVPRQTKESARLYGKWVDSGGDPAKQRRVLLHRDADGAQQQMVVVTDLEGHYEAWISAGTWRVTFGNDQYVPSLKAKEELLLNHRDPDFGGASVLVSVEGAQIQPWNALISLSGEKSAGGSVQALIGRTNESGLARFEGVRPGSVRVSGRLLRRLQGRPLQVEAWVTVVEGGAASVVLKAPEGRLAVECFDAALGTPITGAEVQFRRGRAAAPVASGVTDAAGACLLDGAGSGPGLLLVTHPGYPPIQQALSFPVREGRERLTLSAGGAVTADVQGRSRDGTWRPMAVVLRGRSTDEPPRVWEWRMDEQGKGTIDRLPMEDVELELLTVGFEPLRVRTAEILARSHFPVRFSVPMTPP